MNSAAWLVSALMVALLTGRATADPLLFAPTGTTLMTGQIRAEAAFGPDDPDASYYWLSAGFQQFELSAVRAAYGSGADENIVGLQWSFLPETTLTPAVSFGVRDVASQSTEGIGIYGTITRHLPIGASSRLLKDLSVTAGIGIGGVRGPFAGVEVKLPWRLFVQAEYDSRDLNGAFGWEPLDRIRLKAYNIRREFFLGAELAPIRF